MANETTPPIAQVLQLIRSLPPKDLCQLMRTLADQGGVMGGHVVVDYGIWKLATNTAYDALKLLFELDKTLSKSRAGPKARKARTAQRNAEIDKAIDSGITDPEKILLFVQEHGPELVHSGRTKKPIDSKWMMRMFRRAKNGDKNCNHSE